MDSVLMLKIRFQNIHKNFPGDVTISPVFKKIAGWILLNMTSVQQKRRLSLCEEDTARKVDRKISKSTAGAKQIYTYDKMSSNLSDLYTQYRWHAIHAIHAIDSHIYGQS